MDTDKKSTEQVRDVEYNPYDHRKVAKPNSDVRSAANLIKASLGSGLLAVPLAFSYSGWAVGLAGTVVIGLVCTHCVHIFVKTSHGCCKAERQPSLSYAETVGAAFKNGPKSVRKYSMAAHTFAEFSVFLTYIGVCCVYTILISDSIKQVIDNFFPEHILSVEYYCLIILVPLILLTQIKYLKFLAIFSMVANALLVATFAICLYYIFGSEITVSDKLVYNDISRLPGFLSIVIFAMEGIGVVMPVENTMKTPQHFLGCPSVLTVSMAIITALYASLGLFGYFRFGEALRGSITLNLPLDDWPALCAKVFIALSIFFTYPLQFYVVIDIITKYTEPHIKECYRNKVQIVTRVIGVVVCVGIGMALPMLEQIINLVGAFFYSILGLLIPTVIETIFRLDDLGCYKWILWKNIIIHLFGWIALITGCMVGIQDIIRILHEKTM